VVSIIPFVGDKSFFLLAHACLYASLVRNSDDEAKVTDDVVNW
jgi:hypothetical protein